MASTKQCTRCKIWRPYDHYELIHGYRSYICDACENGTPDEPPIVRLPNVGICATHGKRGCLLCLGQQ